MKVLSFDVGIRNLGVVIIEKTHDQQYIVQYMDTIDILDNNNNNHACPVVLNGGKRKGQPCNKRAQYQYKKTEKWYCGMHFPDSHGKKKKKKRLHSKNISIEQLNISIIDALNRYEEFLDVDRVVIENQSSRASMRMKVVSHILFTYYVLKGIGEVRLCNATNKLKVYTGPEVICITKEDYDKKQKEQCKDCVYYIRGMPRKAYDERKARSIRYCELIMEDVSKHCELQQLIIKQEIKEKFRRLKKRDDVADALLQCIWYLLKIE